MKRYSPCGHMALDETTAPERCPLCSPGARTKTIKPKRAGLDLNGIFKGQLISVGMMVGQDGLREEYFFHQRRKWRFDFAWPEHKIAVEIHGGTYIPLHLKNTRSMGAHSRGAHQRKDFEKWSEAAILGWRILHGDTKDVTKKVLIEKVVRILRKHNVSD